METHIETEYSKGNRDFNGLMLPYLLLKGACLQNCHFKDSSFYGSNLEGANLQQTNLVWTCFSRANLEGADLRGSLPYGADFTRANLRGADLSGIDLNCANFYKADLHGANLTGTKLIGAELMDAMIDEEELKARQIVPPVGTEFVAWKKLKDGVVCKLLIPAAAGRVGGVTGRKCRAEYVTVLEGTGISNYNPNYCYIPGQTVTAYEWDPDMRIECSGGIHFFMTKEEAEEYNF